MTGCRSKAWLAAAALGALLQPAAAQWTSDQPPTLGPGDYPPVATEETPPAGATAAPRPLNGAAPATVQTLPAPGTPVEVDTLGTPEGPPVGTLDAAHDGLGDHLWSGSERARMLDLVQRAPLLSGDPVLRDLVRRVLLTRAPAPPGQASRSFTGLRIERLLDAGLVREAGEMAAQAQIANDERFARIQAGAILLANRAADACGPATAARQTSGDVFWMQLRSYCARIAGDTAAADLTDQVLAAQGHGDAAFDTLVQGIIGHNPLPPGAIAHPNAVHIFLLQQAGLPVTEAVARNLGTVENLLVMRDARNSPRARFEAAERIVTTGIASAAELRAIADAQDLPLSRVSAAASEAPNLPFFMGQVVLRRAAAIEQRPAEKLKLIALALALGEKAGQLPLATALQADMLEKLRPSTQDLNPGIARALLLAGRPDLAGRWAPGDPVMKVILAYASRDPAKIAAVQGDLSAFAAALAKIPPDPDPQRQTKALLLGLADVLALPMPADARAIAVSLQSQMWDGDRPGQMRTLEEIAARPERRGEAVLTLAATVQTIGLKTMAPDVTIALVRLLKQMNQPATARALAIEALAWYVPPPLPPPPATP